ncbi:transporter substrate-binding domain-containing protein [Pseudomonas sp. No.21]|uniref:substrate-binding periplasmic protein n=1 Tax=Pseudomonas TaxID=286 RepID=UPI000DAACB83|nr:MULTISPECIES: transporter substrate-binding domain-containing protein [Pseudomonas]MDW3710938.1 transporter substrate-binding domain-containing protein [Pseudomonas sp. 2023EL-01195]PZE15101.1 amino acid ABC transporter substrate-binding protein [Pseudomonas sp. 57B-090624]GJN47362.1 amino acid ABC transporter substrate-binding protein [Pseudomonas tohonis]
MKKTCSVLLLLVLLCSGPLRAEHLRLVADTWPPFTDASLPEGGLAVDLVVTALERAGHSTEYVEVPWARALRGLEVGDYDVVINAWYDQARAVYGLYSRPYLVNRVRFLRHRGAKIDFQTLADLRPYSIAVVRGYAYSAEFDQDPTLDRVPVMGFEMGARMLAAGRVQLTLEDELVARYHLNRELKELKGQLEFLPRPLSENNLAILVRRSHPMHRQVVEDFDRAMQSMRDDGTYQRIFDRHGF